VVIGLRRRGGEALQVELHGRAMGRHEASRRDGRDSDQSNGKKERDLLISAPAPCASTRGPRLWDEGCDGGNPLMFSCEAKS
jgi:hypothetical protein